MIAVILLWIIGVIFVLGGILSGFSAASVWRLPPEYQWAWGVSGFIFGAGLIVTGLGMIVLANISHDIRKVRAFLAGELSDWLEEKRREAQRNKQHE